ncbi:MAG: hypothetical protein ACSHXD_16465 [Marinosulfonomonas sp.]
MPGTAALNANKHRFYGIKGFGVIYAILLLGLLPLAMLPGNEVPPPDDEPDPADDDSTDPPGDLLDSHGDGPDPSTHEDGLDPTIEDDVPNDPDQPVVEGLGPTNDDDAPPDPGTDPVAGLDPTVEDDTVIETAEPFQIDGFDPEVDTLNIVMSEPNSDEVGDVSVEPNEEGTDSEIYVDHVLVAVLKGVTHATEENVLIEYE